MNDIFNFQCNINYFFQLYALINISYFILNSMYFALYLE
jgi:hypothetical protein